ncbi:integral membrane protein [Streptomyces albus]|uniref:Integral membrane protein n=1 Tax=Streptomyces albus (strain ATCC 21838 / DSM 41398 / FERM P-419 / JCM 4703 / NBRC 107858) TaxID=1081613 RepID=A0A0B5EW72_STRA4|nr:integral membrane protein [Streptomyces albus]AOU77242.1 integral membrane protein [Streptomyces albus]AYN33019.1 integral membrane protein [Streptomyces albus]
MRATGDLFGTVLRAASGEEPPVVVSREDAREAARRELTKGRYHDQEPSLFQRALDRFWDWLDQLLNSASGATPGGGLGLTVIVLAVLALAALLWWRLGAPRRTPSADKGAALFEDRARTAAEHRAQAEAHAAQGHWNQAVQERMRALVRALEERALLDPRPGRTADEAAAEAGRPLPAHAERLRTAARAFDDIAYGGRRATSAAYEELTALDGELERAKPDLAASAATGRGSWEAIR